MRLTSTEQKGRIITLILLATLFLNTVLDTTGCLCHKGTLQARNNRVDHQDPKSFSVEFLSTLAVCTGACDYSCPNAELCWIVWGSSQPISLTCWDLFEWQHNHLVYKPLLPYHLQICWGCTLSHYPHRWWRCWIALEFLGNIARASQLVFLLLIAVLWAQQLSQFSVNLTVYLSRPYFILFCMRMLRNTASKTLLKPG